MTKWALGRKKEVEKPGFFGGFYMVGIPNKLSEDPVVCSFIMISTRLSILSSPHSSIILPLFVLCFALISRLHPFLLDFSVSLVYLQTIAIFHASISLKTCNKIVWNVRTFFTWIICSSIAVVFVRSFFNRDSFPSHSSKRVETSATNNFIALFASVFTFDRRKIVRNLPPRGDSRRTRRARSITLAPLLIDGADYFA